jgi:hypothetical protein
MDLTLAKQQNGGRNSSMPYKNQFWTPGIKWIKMETTKDNCFIREGLLKNNVPWAINIK